MASKVSVTSDPPRSSISGASSWAIVLRLKAEICMAVATDSQGVVMEPPARASSGA